MYELWLLDCNGSRGGGKRDTYTCPGHAKIDKKIIQKLAIRNFGPLSVFYMPRVPFAFEFECEWQSGNSATKQSLNYHLAILEKSVEWLNAIWLFDWLYPILMNGNSATVLSLSCHLAVKTQTQTEPEVFRKHCDNGIFLYLSIPLFVSCFIGVQLFSFIHIFSEKIGPIPPNPGNYWCDKISSFSSLSGSILKLEIWTII